MGRRETGLRLAWSAVPAALGASWDSCGTDCVGKGEESTTLFFGSDKVEARLEISVSEH